MRIYKEFLFEAAHFLPSAPKGHPNSRIHGHSFRVRVTIEGHPEPETGLIMHFESMQQEMAALRAQLDHHFLNEIEDLPQPTLERLSEWIWNKLSPRLPGLHEVGVFRDSCQEGCVYNGPTT